MGTEAEVDNRPGTAEKVFTGLVLLLSTGAFFNLSTDTGPNIDPGAGMLVMQLAWATVYLLTVGLLLHRCRRVLQMLRKEWLLVLLVGLAVVSVFWSDAPAVTFRRSLALVGTWVFAAYFAARYPLKEQLKMLGWTCGIAVAFSFIFGFLKLGTPVEQLEGAWFGIFVHKNVLGRMMVLSTLVFLTLAMGVSKYRRVAWCGMGLSVLLIFLSTSKTALIVFLGLLGLFLTSRILRRNSGRGIAALVLWGVATTAVVVWGITHLEILAEPLGKDITLTGRLVIWFLALVMALQKPWLGYGYNAFWLGAEGPSLKIWFALRWPTPHAHNGFLDLWLELGVLGVALFLVGFAVYTGRAVRLLQRTHEPEAIWPLLFLGFMLLSNLTESSILRANTIFWILYVAVAYRVSSEYRIAAYRLPITTPKKRASWFTNRQTNTIFGPAAAARMKGKGIATSHQGDYPQQCES